MTPQVADTLRWKIEWLRGRACGGCGDAIDADTLMRHFEMALREFSARGLVIKRAALQLELESLCHRCWNRTIERVRGDGLLQTLVQRRRGELTDFFQNSPACIEGNPRIREPQRLAYEAVRAYFARETSLPAMVEIPTGCGKTGIICTVPFGIARGRVLILTPNLTIKRSVVKSLSVCDESGQPNEDNFYLKTGVFDRPEQLPRFVILQRGKCNREDCVRADIVVSNVQQMAGWIRHLDRDFFDFVIVDEAHHEPAETWQKVSEAFPGAKKLLLTATPDRADGKPLLGETVYRYKMAQAIANGYVKNIVKVDAVASRMTFSVADEVREFGAEEILSMREEGWFSKGVALSPLCNATIVEQSIAIWKRKRQSGVQHQIISAACSIRHAIQIVEQYRERGVAAMHVASEGMTMDDRLERIAAFERGEFPCIVHVGILGEGYDNPNISIAAIFRPYRSLSPYAQFVGRAIRWVRGAKPDDNLAHVVSHVGLNLGFLWEYYKHESRQAAFGAYLDQLFFQGEGGDGYAMETELLELEDAPDFGAQVTREEIEGFDIDSFLPCPGLDLAYLGPRVERVAQAAATFEGRAFNDLGRERENSERRSRIDEVRRRGGNAGREGGSRWGRSGEEKTLELPFGRPDIERQLQRAWLNKEVQRAAGFALFQLRAPIGVNLSEMLGHPDSEPYGAVVRAMHRGVNVLMDKDPHASERNDWSLDELHHARQLVGQARESLLREIRGLIQARDQLALPF